MNKTCLVCEKKAKSGEHFCSSKCEEEWIAKTYPKEYEEMKRRNAKAKDTVRPVPVGDNEERFMAIKYKNGWSVVDTLSGGAHTVEAELSGVIMKSKTEAEKRANDLNKRVKAKDAVLPV